MTKREKWLVGVLTGLLVPAVTAASHWVAKVNETLALHATSLAVGAAVEVDVKDRLVRIEDKLDRVIVRGK